jgi:hypothetical protein
MLPLETGYIVLHKCNLNLLKAFQVYCKLYLCSQLLEKAVCSKWIVLDRLPIVMGLQEGAFVVMQHGENV